MAGPAKRKGDTTTPAMRKERANARFDREMNKALLDNNAFGSNPKPKAKSKPKK
jgi:hypothetical protein